MREVKKGWGKEVIFADEEEYCGKFLIFENVGSKGSMHFHVQKKETWYVLKGRFIVKSFDVQTGMPIQNEIGVGNALLIPRHFPHQLIALEADSIIVEVSTKDNLADNIRIEPGDSQNDNDNGE